MNLDITTLRDAFKMAQQFKEGFALLSTMPGMTIKPLVSTSLKKITFRVRF